MSDFVTYASNRGDIAGRMKRWEQCYCGPEPKSYNNFDEWENFFNEDIILFITHAFGHIIISLP